ncbi:MAG TPA: DivIVA domain-containing protein [Segeticoccus sp.]|uniref:DivIVA domain-containing protein n=1 Tax=Segeticoccus sp. TaxID=2706531 RepID=UPI002D7FDFBB|nr:DivIVA domain-containing protein [Segeticoccus sp.]HET8599883.1 DivIVA domain-containing protein [Segeticoccus sp.]
MIVLLVVIVVVLIGLTAAAVAGRVGAGTPPPVSTQSFQPLPPGELDAEDIADLRFDQALRGYRMDQVDGVVERLFEEIRQRDTEIAELRGSAER